MRSFLLIGFGLLFCACTFRSPQSGPTAPPETNKPVVPYQAGEITDTFSWIGKTLEEIGIGSESIDRFGSIWFTCDLFGHTVNGTVYTRVDWDDPNLTKHVYRIWLTDDIPYMAGTEEALLERYGEPYLEDTEPYVESNGGATFYHYTWTGEGVILLKNGQKNTFYEFSYEVPQEIPQEIQKRIDGLTLEEFAHRTGVYFRLEDGDLERLHIDETEYEGFLAYYLTFAHEGMPYRVMVVKSGGSMFDALTPGDEWTEHDTEGIVTSRSMIREDGTGLMYEKNAFGDLWIIETDEPIDGDALLAFESFLLNRWMF